MFINCIDRKQPATHFANLAQDLHYQKQPLKNVVTI